jgi:hypothetical protein
MRERATPSPLRACAAWARRSGRRRRARAAPRGHNSRTGVARARRDNSQDGRRAQDPRRRAVSKAGEVPAVRLSLHVDATGVGTLLGKEKDAGSLNGVKSPGTLTLGCHWRLILGLRSDSESANSREKFAALPARRRKNAPRRRCYARLRESSSRRRGARAAPHDLFEFVARLDTQLFRRDKAAT